MGKENKVKRISKNNMTFLEIKSIKGQQLDLTQAEAVTKGKIEGLLPTTVKQGHSSFTLIYNVTGMISLRDYLKNTLMNKELFGFILKNIFDIVKIVEANYFHFSSLLLSLGRVKVEPSSRRLYFVYVPIQNYDNETTLKDFLLKLLDEATFVPGEDLSYVQEYVRILNTGVNFSVFDLEQYINSLTGNVAVQKTKKCPNCGHLVSADANFCTNCQYSYIAKGVTGRTVTYDPFNYEKVIDFSATIKCWMNNLIGNCSVLSNKKVLPKYSISYAKFIVLNQLNCIKVDGEYLPIKEKQSIFNNMFLNSSKNVTVKAIHNYLVKEFNFSNDVVITGIVNNIENPFIKSIR